MAVQGHTRRGLYKPRPVCPLPNQHARTMRILWADYALTMREFAVTSSEFRICIRMVAGQSHIPRHLILGDADFATPVPHTTCPSGVSLPHSPTAPFLFRLSFMIYLLHWPLSSLFFLPLLSPLAPGVVFWSLALSRLILPLFSKNSSSIASSAMRAPCRSSSFRSAVVRLLSSNICNCSRTYPRISANAALTAGARKVLTSGTGPTSACAKNTPSHEKSALSPLRAPTP